MVGVGASASPSASGGPRLTLGSDLSDMLSTEMTGIDTSVLGALTMPCWSLADATSATNFRGGPSSHASPMTCQLLLCAVAALHWPWLPVSEVLYAGMVSDFNTLSDAGVVKRVTGLLLAMTGLGVLLFYVGLKYAFPNGI